MRRRFSRLTRRSLIGAVTGLAFAAAAGVGLAQITTSQGPTLAVSSTTQSQTTGTQTTSTGDQGESGDDQGENGNEQGNQESEQGNQTSTSGSSTSTSTSTPTSTSLSATTTTGADDALSAGQPKMDVCHKTGNGGEHTINIAAPAVPAHLAHDDTLGACSGTIGKHGSTTTTPSTSSTTTTTASTTATGTKSHKPKKASS